MENKTKIIYTLVAVFVLIVEMLVLFLAIGKVETSAKVEILGVVFLLLCCGQSSPWFWYLKRLTKIQARIFWFGAQVHWVFTIMLLFISINHMAPDFLENLWMLFLIMVAAVGLQLRFVDSFMKLEN